MDSMTNHPFDYVASVAAKHGKDQVMVVHLQEEIIDSLSAAELTELAAAYREIERRDDSRPLTRWIREKVEDGLGKQRNQMRMLFFLFNGLGRRGIPPFASFKVQLVEEEVVLDWGKLPTELNYLAEPAEKYGRYEFVGDVWSFLERMSPEESAELGRLVRRTKNDHKKIDDFLDRYDMTKHKEAWLVYCLLGVLDAL